MLVCLLNKLRSLNCSCQLTTVQCTQLFTPRAIELALAAQRFLSPLAQARECLKHDIQAFMQPKPNNRIKARLSAGCSIAVVFGPSALRTHPVVNAGFMEV